MTRRPGLSLTEVLVALFIMGIGTIAILTLFPLGALNMAQAFRDDRCTQAAGQADSFLQWYVKDKAGRGELRPPAPNYERFVEALGNPNLDTKNPINLSPVGTPSYPVVIDPLGYLARGGRADLPANLKGSVCWVGDGGFTDNLPASTNSSALPRRSLRSINSATLVNQQPLAIRTCSLLDGFGFDPSTGSPATVSGGGAVDRDLRYNWVWVVQRVTSDSPSVTVVVFDKRSPTFVPPNAETVWAPTVATVGTRQLSFGRHPSTDPNGVLLPIQKGGWLLDATICNIDRKNGNTVIQPKAGAAPPDVVPWIRNAQFYRVAGVTETGTGTSSSIDVELDTPLRPDTGDIQPGDPALLPTDRRFIYLSGVAEVFERDRPLDFNP